MSLPVCVCVCGRGRERDRVPACVFGATTKRQVCLSAVFVLCVYVCVCVFVGDGKRLTEKGLLHVQNRVCV